MNNADKFINDLEGLLKQHNAIIHSTDLIDIVIKAIPGLEPGLYDVTRHCFTIKLYDFDFD